MISKTNKDLCYFADGVAGHDVVQVANVYKLALEEEPVRGLNRRIHAVEIQPIRLVHRSHFLQMLLKVDGVDTSLHL